MGNYTFSKILSWDSIHGSAQQFIDRGGSGEIGIDRAQTDLMPIGNILLGVGVAILLIVGLIMGVKYMISGADEKANMKQKLIWYVVAAVLIIASVAIYNAIAGVFNASGL